MSHEEEIREFVHKIESFAIQNCPNWLTPNSTGMGIEPGHNLDLLKIWLDFRVDRTSLLLSKTPSILLDPSKPELSVIK